jgi:lipoprotein-anchoring transpeptidase ErfK/SrfK
MTSILPSASTTWTSGAAGVRRRRHRAIALALTGMLTIAAVGVTVASAYGLAGFPGWTMDGVPVVEDLEAGATPAAPMEAPASAPRTDYPVPPPTPDTSDIDPAAPVPAEPDRAEPDLAEPDPAEPDPAPQPVVPPQPDDGTEVGQGGAEQDRTEDEVDVVAVQQRLRELSYLIGPADGRSGQQTIAAVMAFQQVNGLQVDGVVGPQTLSALEAPTREPELRGGPATRIEVDLDRQILHVVEGGERVVTLKVSSGGGQPYVTASGGTAPARTPVGEFVIERRIHGVRIARLGTLYDPLYFHGGYAIHGSLSVPAGPASSGCVRIAKADAVWLIGQVPNGTPVHLYGGVHVFTPPG